MTSVQYQPAAETDLIGAWLQVADDRGVDAADLYISKLREVCELIASQPGMGVDRPDVAADVQSFPVDHYVIYYELHGSTLNVLRVWHAAQDPKSLAVKP